MLRNAFVRIASLKYAHRFVATSVLPMNQYKCNFNSSLSPRFQSTQATQISADESILPSRAYSKIEIVLDNTPVLFHNFWLRDHCHCSQCYHPITRQRLINTFQIPINIQPAAVTRKDGGLEIEWANDGHVSFYTWEWLHKYSYDPPLGARMDSLNHTGPKHLWEAAEISQHPPVVAYEHVMTEEAGLFTLLRNIDSYGFSFIDGCPPNPEKTEDIAKRVAFVRETHYGGFWDFTADLEHGDTAYTNLALKAHTDTTYFTDPCGLQMFHILENDCKGGESLLVDGFNSATQLRQQHPEAYKTLSTLRIPTHSAGDNNVLIVPSPRAYPILNHDPLTGELYQIRYNNDDRSSLNGLSSNEVEMFYDALLKWNNILEDKRNEFWTQLIPGRILLFNNWRILHGRAAFVGHRRMCGAYINWDDYRSKLRISGGLNGKTKDLIL